MAYPERYLSNNATLSSFMNVGTWNPQNTYLKTAPERVRIILCGTWLLDFFFTPADAI